MDPGLFVLVRDSFTATIVLFAARKSVGAWTWPKPADRMPFFILGTFGLYFGKLTCKLDGTRYLCSALCSGILVHAATALTRTLIS